MKKILKMKNKDKFINLNPDPTIEINYEISEDWDGKFEFDEKLINGSRVKPVITIPEKFVEQINRHELRQKFLDLGAIYCKIPIIKVVKKVIKRDKRHNIELKLEDSLKIFAEETKQKNIEYINFAIELAKEADEGVIE